MERSGMIGFKGKNPLARQSDIGMVSKAGGILSELIWMQSFIPTVISFLFRLP